MFYKDLSCKIELKKKLTIPSNKPNIHRIKSTNIDIDILGSKVISTPLNEIVQKGNLPLAKERLLIAGWICIKICYTSLSNSCCINTAFFKVPFNTYISLNKSATCCKDKFSIDNCIKNVCTTLCSCKVFEQKLTLFLRAKKIDSPSPIPPQPIIPPIPDPIPPEPIIPPTPGPIPPEPTPDPPEPEPTPDPPLITTLPNSIVINSNSNKEVAKIEFNTNDNLIIVTSTDEIPDITKGRDAYFGISLQDMITSKLKFSDFIMSNEKATNFQNDLTGVSFEEFDTLQLNSLNPSNIKITNFPIKDETYTLKDTLELFTITPNGLQSFIAPTPPTPPIKDKLPNAIIIKQNNGIENDLVALIEFNILDNKLIVNSSSFIPDTTKDINYFSFKLKDNNNQNIKYSSIIIANKNADTFANDLNNKDFEFNDILELDYSIPNSIVITNYPKAEENYTPTNNKEYYKITPEGLIPYIINV